MADLFLAFDTATLLTSITTVAVVGVTVQLLYLGWKHIRKAGNKI